MIVEILLSNEDRLRSKSLRHLSENRGQKPPSARLALASSQGKYLTRIRITDGVCKLSYCMLGIFDTNRR